MARTAVTRGLVVAVAAALALVVPAGARAQAPQTMRIGADVPKDVPASQGIACLADQTTRRTAGRVKIEYYPDSQLGTPEEQMAGTRAGSQEGWFGAAGQMARLLSPYQIVSPAFAFADRPSVLAVVRSPFFDGIRTELEQKHGLVTLFYDWFRGDRQLLTKRPIRRLADLQGLKLRVPAAPAKVYSWKKLGASPTPIPPSELYMALKEGVVDGVEIELDTMHAQHLDEIAKYLTMTSHESSFASLVVNQAFWRTITPADQASIKAAADECGHWVTTHTDAIDRRAVEAMQKDLGVQVITLPAAERAAFLRVGQEALADLEVQKKWWPAGTVAKIRAKDPQYFRP